MNNDDTPQIKAKKRRLLPYFAVVIVVIIIGGLVALGWLVTHKPAIIPKKIVSQINFVLLYPDLKKSQGSIKKETIKYDPILKQMSLVVNYQGRNITLAEQTTPDQIKDIPAYYPKFIESFNGYSSFENTIGKVDLTRPKELHNQVAVMNTKGTLLFAQTDSDMSDDLWRQLFNTFVNLQPK